MKSGSMGGVEDLLAAFLTGQKHWAHMVTRTRLRWAPMSLGCQLYRAQRSTDWWQQDVNLVSLHLLSTSSSCGRQACGGHRSPRSAAKWIPGWSRPVIHQPLAAGVVVRQRRIRIALILAAALATALAAPRPAPPTPPPLTPAPLAAPPRPAPLQPAQPAGPRPAAPRPAAGTWTAGCDQLLTRLQRRPAGVGRVSMVGASSIFHNPPIHPSRHTQN